MQWQKPAGTLVSKRMQRERCSWSCCFGTPPDPTGSPVTCIFTAPAPHSARGPAHYPTMPCKSGRAMQTQQTGCRLCPSA